MGETDAAGISGAERVEIFQVRGPTGLAIHLLTPASIEPETAALTDICGNLMLVDVNRNVGSEQVHPDVADVALISSGQSTILAVAEATGVTVVCDRNGQREVEHFQEHEGRATGVALFGTNGVAAQMVSTDERGNVLLWDIAARTAPVRRRFHRKAVSRLAATRLADGRGRVRRRPDDRDVLVYAAPRWTLWPASPLMPAG